MTKVMHGGVVHTLSRLRYEYWLPKGRTVVKSVIAKCATRIHHDGAPYAMPSMPPLPAERVTSSVPFTNCGLDYFGPLYVKDESSNAFNKVWICLFTCMVTCAAVHMEVVENMSSEHFLMAFPAVCFP